MNTNGGLWQKAIGRFLGDPTLGVVATLAVVVVAACFLVQNGTHPGAFVLFGRM